MIISSPDISALLLKKKNIWKKQIRSKHLQFCSNKMLLANCARQIFFSLCIMAAISGPEGFVLELAKKQLSEASILIHYP